LSEISRKIHLVLENSLILPQGKISVSSNLDIEEISLTADINSILMLDEYCKDCPCPPICSGNRTVGSKEQSGNLDQLRPGLQHCTLEATSQCNSPCCVDIQPRNWTGHLCSYRECGYFRPLVEQPLREFKGVARHQCLLRRDHYTKIGHNCAIGARYCRISDYYVIS